MLSRTKAASHLANVLLHCCQALTRDMYIATRVTALVVCVKLLPDANMGYVHKRATRVTALVVCELSVYYIGVVINVIKLLSAYSDIAVDSSCYL